MVAAAVAVAVALGWAGVELGCGERMNDGTWICSFRLHTRTGISRFQQPYSHLYYAEPQQAEFFLGPAFLGGKSFVVYKNICSIAAPVS